MLTVNGAEPLAQLSAAFNAYESALLANDIEALNRLFWESPLTMRFGIRESQYSHAEIAHFRRERGPIDQRRVLLNTRITTFGRDWGVANTEYVSIGSDRVGRQSQTWIRTEEGWKIVAAHVSLLR